MKLIILKLNIPHEIFILSETEMDLLLLLVWIIPIIIFVAFGQQIQLYMTSIELKKKIKKIKTLENQSRSELLDFINTYDNADIKYKKIEQMIDYFTIFPTNIDPAGIINKIKHIIRNRDQQTNSTLHLMFPDCDKLTIAKFQTLLEIVTTIRSFYKAVNHIFLTARKHHNYPLILPLQLTLPFIMEETMALKDSIWAIKNGKPIGDGIGPLVINNMIKNISTKHDDIDQTIWCTSFYNERKLYFLKAKGPYPIVGKLGDAIELLSSKYKQNLIILIDASLKLEGEKSASVFCGFGVAMGGIGVDKFQIEEIASKYKIPVFSIIVKQSIQESLTTMTKEISETVDYIKSIIYNVIEENVSSNQSVLLVGVGNTSGIY